MSRGRYQPRPTALAIKADAFDMFFDAPQAGRSFDLAMGGAVAIVDVCGPLAQRPGWFWDSYEEIEQRVTAALASPAKSVMLRIDSPGGDALGCFECSRALRAAAEAAKKPLYAFADGTAASAAYALACSASTILVPPAGFVGSIGVLQALVDATAADAMYGSKITLIASGSRKTDGNPHAPTTQAAVDEIQSRVDSLAGLFFDLVAEARPGTTAAHVRGLEGRMFHGDGAVKAGLADAVKTWSEALAMAAGAVTVVVVAEGAGKMDTEKKAAAIGAIRTAFGDDKDGAEKAINSAFPDEGEDKDKKEKDEKEAKAKAEADDKEKAKAKEEGEKEAKAIAARAAAGDVSVAFDALRQVQELKAQLAAKDEADERRTLLEKRPDFDDKMRASVAKMPLDLVREAVETWPRVGAKLKAVAMPVGTQGKTQGNDATASGIDEELAAKIDERMGRRSTTAVASTYVNGVQVLDFVTPEVARVRLEQIAKEGVK